MPALLTTDANDPVRMAPAGSIPFLIGITGHRDVHPDDHDVVSAAVADTLRTACAVLPNTTITLVSALAQGADRIAARALLDLRDREPDRFGPRLSLLVPLPMSRAAYLADFSGEIECAVSGADWRTLSDDDRARWQSRAIDDFDAVLARLRRGDRYFEIPKDALVAPRTGDWNEQSGAPYALFADYLNVHCHALMAVWDGDDRPERRKRGGTADVVAARLHGFSRATDPQSSRSLAPLERGTVIHIYARRVCDALPLDTDSGASRPQPSVLRPPGARPEKRPLRPKANNYLRTPLSAIEQAREHAESARMRSRLSAAGTRSSGPEQSALAAELWAVGRSIDLFNTEHNTRWRDANYRAEVETGGGLLQSLQDHLSHAAPEVSQPMPNAITQLAEDLGPILFTQAAANALAQRYKRTWERRWLIIAIAAAIAGGSSATKTVAAALISPAAGEVTEVATCAFATLVAIGVYLKVSTSPMRNAYLEFRALAEGLRFQAYWFAAGMRSLTTNHYAMKLHGELGWIRGAIDAVCTLPAVRSIPANTVAWGWILGQANYVGQPARAVNTVANALNDNPVRTVPAKAPISTPLQGAAWSYAEDWMDSARYPGGCTVSLRRRQAAKATARGNRLLALGACIGIVALVLAVLRVPAMIAGVAAALMKLLPVIGAALLTLNSKRGHSEFLKQTDHLKSVYARALQTLLAILQDATLSQGARESRTRDLLVALGKESLAENANWLALLMQRKVTWHGK